MPWLALFASRTFFAGRRRISLAVVSLLAVYANFRVSDQLFDARLAAELDAFDLNHDGSFSAEEISPAQEAAMRAFTNDTGRVFAPYTGAVIAVVYVALVFAFWSRLHGRRLRQPP